MGSSGKNNSIRVLNFNLMNFFCLPEKSLNLSIKFSFWLNQRVCCMNFTYVKFIVFIPVQDIRSQQRRSTLPDVKDN